MSRTDKTRPYRVKEAELAAADPYGARREHYASVPALWGCPSSCWMCRGHLHEENRRSRREGKRAARDWEREL